MNAIEMAVKSVIEKSLPSLLPSLIANIPPDVFDNIRQIGQIAVSLRAQLDRIENHQRLILARLETEQEGHEQIEGYRNGSDERSRSGDGSD